MGRITSRGRAPAVSTCTGCGLPLDVNDVHVSAANRGFDPFAYLDGIPAQHVRQGPSRGPQPEQPAARVDAGCLPGSPGSARTGVDRVVAGDGLRRARLRVLAAADVEALQFARAEGSSGARCTRLADWI